MGHFPIDLTPDDNGTVLVTCAALPEVTTYGATRDAAIVNAGRAVDEAIAARIAAGRDVPRPRVMMMEGQTVVRTDYWTDVKVSLHRALLERRMNRAELARRLHWHREQVDRLFRLDHASRPDKIEAAFHELGYDVALALRDRATGAVVAEEAL